jgi:hypothetical protein
LLSSTNIRETRNQTRASIVRVDPFGSAQRSCRRLIRHDYVTLEPDHKLIRYGLITHGGVDGCSRVNNNNTALTVCGITEFQMPDKIRGDGGGENVLRRRGMDRGSLALLNPVFYGFV